jgi:hypothetical protein
MGADFSKLPAEHRRIYQNILNIQSPGTRAQMIQTLLSSPEHTESARAAGVYGHLLHYVQSVKEGRAPPPLPGQGQGGAGSGQVPAQPQVRSNQSQITVHRTEGVTVTSQKGNEKAINYFSACLRILGLEEEVALTDSVLKAAYKKAALRSHPDKGGSEKEFEAVTKAFAYLGEILTRIRGGRAVDGKVEAPTALASGREEAADKWKIEPVQLNPSKLNVDAFNSMFEKTRIPDPEESGYGDWLKTDEQNKSTNFSGKFNRDVFHKAFEEESSQRPMRGGGNAIVAQELSLARGMGYVTELGRTSRDDYTVAAVETGKGQSFTDLKKAYTEYNTFTHQTANVKVSSNRNLDQMATERKAAPAPLADSEMSALRDAEMAFARQEELRKRRVAEEAIAENSYFERMKRLVIRN